jgi:hypothetical protein
MNKMPECLECKIELECDDTVDMCVGEEFVEMKNIGHCPKCGKKYRWKKDMYTYSPFKNLEEED